MGNSWYYIYNAHGDVVKYIDASGAVLKSYDYDAFGEEVDPNSADGNPFRYAGQYFDSETGTYYLRARYYSPALGRFSTEDPIRYGLNWYVYVNNNPIKYFDPTGLRSKEVADKIIKDNALYIISAAQEFGIDPVSLAATIYAEQRENVNWIDDYIDGIVGFWGMADTSIGIGQIKISTAKLLEEEGYMPKITSKNGGWRLPFIGFIYGTERMAREKALEDPKTNIRYAAAYLKYYQDRWGSVYPEIADRTDILATLYNQGELHPPHANPGSTKFGEFAMNNYDYVKTLLGLE